MYIHTYIYTYINIHTYIHIYTCMQRQLVIYKYKKNKKEKRIQHHAVPGWSPTPVLSGLNAR